MDEADFIREAARLAWEDAKVLLEHFKLSTREIKEISKRVESLKPLNDTGEYLVNQRDVAALTLIGVGGFSAKQSRWRTQVDPSRMMFLTEFRSLTSISWLSFAYLQHRE
jgi:hypothetical protein